MVKYVHEWLQIKVTETRWINEALSEGTFRSFVRIGNRHQKHEPEEAVSTKLSF